jgi:hypothetical protein
MASQAATVDPAETLPVAEIIVAPLQSDPDPQDRRSFVFHTRCHNSAALP